MGGFLKAISIGWDASRPNSSLYGAKPIDLETAVLIANSAWGQ
jgi:hypothetical protein